jgi:hypothetical protein
MPYQEFKMGGGLNQKGTPDLINDSQLQTAVGCRFDEVGAVTSAAGPSSFISTSGEIKGMFEIFRNGTRHRMIRAGSLVQENNTQLILAFTGDSHMSGTHYRDIAYFGDGVQFKAWDGSAHRDVGIDAPETALTLAIGNGATPDGGTGYLAAGDYLVSYYWAIVDPDTDSKRIIRAAGNWAPHQLAADIATTTGTDGYITVTGFEAKPSAATHAYIIRTDVGGDVFFYDQRVDVSGVSDTTTLTVYITGDDGNNSGAGLPPGAEENASPGDDPRDHKGGADDLTAIQERRYDTRPARPGNPGGVILPDRGSQDENNVPQVVLSNLGYVVNWVDHDKPPQTMRSIIFHQQQLFGIDETEQMIRFSRPNEPEHWSVFNGVRPGRRSSERLMALMSFNEDVICYTDQRIYRLESVGLAFEDARLQDLGSPVGLASETGVCQVTFGTGQTTAHVFASSSGVFLFDGQNVREISHLFERIWKGEDPDDGLATGNIDKVVCTSFRDKVWMSYPHSGSTNNRTLYMDFEDPQGVKISVDRVGYTTMYTDRNPSQPTGSSGVGFTVQEVDGGGDGAEIEWVVKTKEYPLGESNAAVSVESVAIDIDAPTSVTATVEGDTGRSETFTIAATSGRERVTRRLPHSFKANRVSLKLSSTAAVERTFYGVGFTFMPQGTPNSGAL